MRQKSILDRVIPLLCDPANGEPLRLEGQGFKSRTRSYPIIHGIPRFVPWAQRHAANPWIVAIRKVFPFSIQGLGLENDILDTFDGYSPRYHGTHTPEEVEGWFRDAGLVDIFRPSSCSTCVRGTKPKRPV